MEETQLSIFTSNMRPKGMMLTFSQQIWYACDQVHINIQI